MSSEFACLPQAGSSEKFLLVLFKAPNY